MRIEESIVIDRPRADVFAYLVDRRHDVEWMGSVVESDWLDPGDAVAVGRRGRMVLKLFGKRSEIVDEVSEYIPGEHIAHRIIEGTFLLDTACLTRAEGQGRARATVVAEADRLVGGPFGRLAGPLMERIMRRGFKADLRRLKRILEADAGPAARGADWEQEEVREGWRVRRTGLREDRLKVLPEDIFDAYERLLVAAVFEPWGRRLIEAANIQSGEDVLDLACGTGIVARLAAPLVGDVGAVTGLDLLPGMLNVARREARGLRPEIVWIEGDATKMPIPDASFDVVLCQQGLQFFSDKVSALTEVRRVLKPGGRLVLTVWRSIDRSPGVAALQQALERHAPDAAPVLPIGFSLSDAEELRTYISKAGFSDGRITIVVGSARFEGVDDFLQRYLSGLPIAGQIAGLPAERRAAIAADVSDALRGHVDDSGIVFPTEINQVFARA